jgi:3,4-dihydroxy 2-butanone 4-phosphate synthase / GTP cyclohydrolase II
MTFRDFGLGAQILRSLGARRLRILTNHPVRFGALAGFGLVAEEFIPLP